MMSWGVTPEASSEDNAYLADLVEQAAGNQGLTLPTLGLAGLEVAPGQQLFRGARSMPAGGELKRLHSLPSAVVDPGQGLSRLAGTWLHPLRSHRHFASLVQIASGFA